MTPEKQTRKRPASVVRIAGILAIVCLCCVALAPAVTAAKWIANTTYPVQVNNETWGYVNGVQFSNCYFFAAVANAYWNTTNPPYTYTQNATYPDRFYLEQLKVDSVWFPNPYVGGDWQWEFVNNLTCQASIYKKGLGGYVSQYPADQTTYLWYGNKTNATVGPYKNSSWICPTEENATYLAKLETLWY